MKKIFKLAALALVLMMMFSLFAGCGSDEDKGDGTDTSSDTSSESSPSPTSDTSSDTKIKIGLSLATLQEERWVRDKEKMEALAGEKGIELLTQVANLDAAKQDSQCENLISQGIKILIIAPQDAKSAASIVEKAHKAGIKVISYDRLIMDCDVDVYISFDNVKVGELQGKYLTEKLPKGNIVFLSGAPTDNNAKLFKQGAEKYIRPKVDSGDYKIVMEQGVKDWKPDEAMKLMEQALTANKNDIQGVLAPNDGTAGGCIQAMAAQGLAGKVPITGQDAELAAAKRIVEGTQSMTIFKDTRALATAAIEAALKMANGESLDNADQTVNNDKIDVPSILLTPIAVDKDNLDKELIDSGYLKKEDVYSK